MVTDRGPRLLRFFSLPLGLIVFLPSFRVSAGMVRCMYLSIISFLSVVANTHITCGVEVLRYVWAFRLRPRVGDVTDAALEPMATLVVAAAWSCCIHGYVPSSLIGCRYICLRWFRR
jgi:hypothetical protein